MLKYDEVVFYVMPVSFNKKIALEKGNIVETVFQLKQFKLKLLVWDAMLKLGKPNH
jgi:hypothetical protein